MSPILAPILLTNPYLVAMGRYTLKPFTFSNGVTVPAGIMVTGHARGVHHDSESYDNPDVFMPWRFSEIRDEEGEGTKHQLVAVANNFINFGHGRHAWYVNRPCPC
jgi:cytochrome P450